MGKQLEAMSDHHVEFIAAQKVFFVGTATTDSRPEYERRMHRVVAFVDAHLDAPLDTKTLAAVAHFSPFHFHRLFTAWMGETVGDYRRRRRVEVAAMRMAAQPRTKILDVALSVGFGSGEAFARAFRHRFGCSPTAWRERRASERREKSNPGQADSKGDQAATAALGNHRVHPQQHLEIPMHVRLVDRHPVTVVCLRRLGPYDDTILRFWQETYYPWAVRNDLLGQPRYGISHDDPGITAPAQCRYDACAEVPDGFVPPGEGFVTTIPGGTYAVGHFDGTVQAIGDAWAALLRDWLPASGFQLDARPAFEHYPRGARHDPADGSFECEICVPVVPL